MGKSSSTTIGYKYRMGIQLALTEGPLDEIPRFIYGERDAYVYDPSAPAYPPAWWAPDIFGRGEPPDQVKQNTRLNTDVTVHVHAANILGGEKREGGAEGLMTINMGTSAIPDPYLQTHVSADVPAYIGVTSVIFKSFMWSALTPYFKAPWFETIRLFKNWKSDVIWYPEKLVIGVMSDMNPAHIIYQCITDDRFGMNYPIDDIDDVSFRAAADKLYSEGFGLSYIWDQDMAVEDFMNIVISTIDADLRLDMTTGKFLLKLIRDDYLVASLTEVGPDQIVSMSSFQRAGWGELANQITVIYTDRDQNQQPVEVQDLAAFANQGRVVAVTKEYLGIREVTLALRVAQRDLALSSATLAKVSLTIDRTLWAHEKADVFAFTWPRLGLNKVPFRIVSINKGNMTNGMIEVEAVEDVFGLPTTTYVGTQGSQWEDPAAPAEPALYQRVEEVNYRDIVRHVPAEQQAQFTPDYCFGKVSVIQRTGSYFGFELFYGALAAGPYSSVAKGNMASTAVTQSAISYLTGTVALTDIINEEGILASAYAIIDSELVAVTGFDTTTKVLSFVRGVIDSVPAKHTTGVRVWFNEVRNAVDPTQRLPGTTAYYKPCPTTGYGSLAVPDAALSAITFTGRAQRPYPPGNLKVNTFAYPDYMTGPLSVTWASRNRIIQGDQLIPTTAGSIQAEGNTSYNITIKGETGITLITSNTEAENYFLDTANEYQSGVVEYGTDQIVIAIGLVMVESTLSNNIAGTPENGYGKVDSGWMRAVISPTQVNGQYVDGTTGALTTRSDNSLTSQLTVTVYSVKPSLPILDRYQEEYFSDNPSEAIAAGFTPYNGWAAYGTPSTNVNVATDVIPQGTPILDRRVNPTHVFVRAASQVILGYSGRTVVQAKEIGSYQLAVFRMNKSAVVSGPLAITRTVVTSYLFGSPNQFDSLDALPDTSTFSTILTYGSPLAPSNLGIIYDELMYLPGFEGFGPVNSTGKPLDITNILTAHITIQGGRRDATFVMHVDSAGVVTSLSVRTGIVLSDKLTATQGFEVNVNTRGVNLVNSTTGVPAGALGSVGASGDIPIAVYGDYVNQHMYILVIKPNVSVILYKYSLAFSLLAQITLPATQSVLSRATAAITSSAIREGGDSFYVRCGSLSVAIKKDFSFIRNLADIGSQMYVPYPGYSNPSSSIVKLGGKSKTVAGADRGLADENGNMGLNYYTNDRPRIQGRFTIELDSMRDGLNSTQKHNYVVDRYGYGLHYGEYYGD